MYVTRPNDELMAHDLDIRLVAGNDEIDRAKRDPEAFASLYEEHGAGIYRMCLRATGNPDLADDLTATVFLKVFERLDQYVARPGSSFRAWIHVLALNVARDHWRHTNRISLLQDDAAVVMDESPGPEDIVLHRISLEEVRNVLGTLSDRHRTIVELRLAGLSTREIANALGMTISALKSAQTRAYKTIREQLAPEGAAQ